MGLAHLPVIKMARRVIQKHGLEPPFDLRNLVDQYAKVIYKPIPVQGVDGICLNLKTAGKTPTVIVNSDSPRTRQKFTLAHELGHIIIPWHSGTIIDELDVSSTNSNSRYWELETEANRFASELLMPFYWVYALYKVNPNPESLQSQLCALCGVSEQAASIRIQNAISEIERLIVPAEWISQLQSELIDLALIQEKIIKETKLSPKRVAEQMVQHLPGKVSFCIERRDIVIEFGSTTRNAHSFFQMAGEKFVKAPYSYFQRYSVHRVDDVNTHWWVLDNSFDIPSDSRSWRDILEKIANDIAPPQGVNQFKTTVNAKLSGAHGNWRRKNPGSGVEKFIEDAVLRFNNPEYVAFVQHPDFLAFIKRRCESFFSVDK